MMNQLLELIIKGGAVKRYHNEMVTPQTVGHHSYGVAWLCWILSGQNPSSALLMAAISHDTAEGVVGDVPAPTKRAIPGLKAMLDEYEERAMKNAGISLMPLTGTEVRILKLADVMEGMMFCISERATGNQNAEVIYANFVNYATQLKLTGVEITLFTMLQEGWDHVSQ